MTDAARFPASDVVVRATDTAATGAFFSVLGFAATSEASDDKGVRLLQRGTDRAGIVVERATHPAVQRPPYASGPAAIDIYTRDIEASVRMVADAGYRTGALADLSVGPVALRQVRVLGPDAVPVVLVESSHRRSSILDASEENHHSEGHSLVWVIGDRDAEAAWWVERGATKGIDLDFGGPGVSRLLDLPDPSVDVRMTMLSDAAVLPFRLELLEFTGRSEPQDEGSEGAAGIVGLRLGGEATAWARSPGGVRFQQ